MAAKREPASSYVLPGSPDDDSFDRLMVNAVVERHRLHRLAAGNPRAYRGDRGSRELGHVVLVTLRHRPVAVFVEHVLLLSFPREVRTVEAGRLVAGSVSGDLPFVGWTVEVDADQAAHAVSAALEVNERVAPRVQGVRPQQAATWRPVDVGEQEVACRSLVEAGWPVMREAKPVELGGPDAVVRQASRVVHIGTPSRFRSRPGALQRRRASSCRCHHGSAQTPGGN